MTEQRYFTDPLKLEFDAEISESVQLPDGRFAIVMPETYFYPTGGGQDHDRGVIGEAQVLDVYKEGSRIVHILDRQLKPGVYPAAIERQRRWRNMQHHTAQHALTGAFVSQLGLETVSAHISGETPSTIDLDADVVSSDELKQVEKAANMILFENREVKSYFVTEAQVEQIPFRKAPVVQGKIRVIEVDGFDYSACGGTHCPQTGMVGMLKIVRTERINQKLRVHFVAGIQALEYFQSLQESNQSAAGLLGINLDQVPEEVGRLLNKMEASAHELKELRSAAIENEAFRLLEGAVVVGQFRLVTALVKSIPAADLRTVAMTLRSQPGHISLLAAYEEGKLSMVAACAEDTRVSARELLAYHLEPLGCRGGGDTGLAQGGGLVSRPDFEKLFRSMVLFLKKIQKDYSTK
ncbi:MAG: hypothetical protein JXA13_08335 [Anaerolineales bacterium]|nr:hypothetical protein [Anaerolineales bacterium]